MRRKAETKPKRRRLRESRTRSTLKSPWRIRRAPRAWRWSSSAPTPRSDAVVDESVRHDVNDDSDAPLSAAQEEAWSKAAVAVPGTSTSASPAALEANLADMQTAENEVAAAEASAAAARDAAEDDVDLNAETNAAFAEADRAYEHLVIDAGSGAAVPTALVAPLSDDALRDAGTPGGGES